MSRPTTELTAAIAGAVRSTRVERDLSVTTLAAESAVSRAMIAKVERGEVQPTAALLAKLANALGLTLSGLIARAENSAERLIRRDDQPRWTDPKTGYLHRAVSPPAANYVELVEVELPAGTQVSSPAESCRFSEQQVVVYDGVLLCDEGEHTHELHPGDCLALDTTTSGRFRNPATTGSCRYLVVLHKVTHH